MIANISSSVASFEETLNTLKYANRAKNIKTNVQRNVLSVNHHISEYVSLIENLRDEIQTLKGQLRIKQGERGGHSDRGSSGLRSGNRLPMSGGKTTHSHRKVPTVAPLPAALR